VNVSVEIQLLIKLLIKDIYFYVTIWNVINHYKFYRTKKILFLQ